MKYLILAVLIAMIFAVKASLNVYTFENSADEKRFYSLIQSLRCPKCQNNHLADSNAPLATDIKKYVYQAVKAGQGSKEITDFLVSRYGEFITYRPRNRWLWGLPFALGILGFGVAVQVIRQRRLTPIAEATLSMSDIIRDYEQERR